MSGYEKRIWNNEKRGNSKLLYIEKQQRNESSCI